MIAQKDLFFFQDFMGHWKRWIIKGVETTFQKEIFHLTFPLQSEKPQVQLLHSHSLRWNMFDQSFDDGNDGIYML